MNITLSSSQAAALNRISEYLCRRALRRVRQAGVCAAALELGLTTDDIELLAGIGRDLEETWPSVIDANNVSNENDVNIRTLAVQTGYQHPVADFRAYGLRASVVRDVHGDIYSVALLPNVI